MKRLFMNASGSNFCILFAFFTSLSLLSCSKSETTPTPSAATISAVTSPTGTTSGPKNTVITISGTNFITDLSKIQVKVNGKDCVVLSATATAITARIPAGCGTGVVQLFLNGTMYTGPVFNFIYTYALTSVTDGQSGNVYGSLAGAKFDEIESVSFDQSDNLYLGQYDFPKVKKITANGIVSLLAGSGVSGYLDANGATAQFVAPEYTSPGSDGNLYVGDNARVRKISVTGTVTTLYTSPNAGQFMGIKAMPTGIYLAGTNVLAKISYTGTLIWSITTKPALPPFDDMYDLDGDTSIAKFNTYGNLEVDSMEQNIYFSNYDFNHSLNGHKVWKLKKLNLSTHAITTIAGANIGADAQDGLPLQATFSTIADMRLDKLGGLWIADMANHKVRLLKDGGVTTIIGIPGQGDIDGDLNVAKIKSPTGLAFDSHGQLYIGCVGNRKIKKLTID